MILRHEPWDLLTELNSILGSSVQRQKNQDDSKVVSSHWIPAVDIKEEADQFLIFVDIPGVKLADIHVSMENNVLTVKGNREETSKEEKNNFHRIERVSGAFYRRFTLPDSADAEQIHAKSKQGVLEISIGKKKLAASRKIEVKMEE